MNITEIIKAYDLDLHKSEDVKSYTSLVLAQVVDNIDELKNQWHNQCPTKQKVFKEITDEILGTIPNLS
jgi:hypothetical protein